LERVVHRIDDVDEAVAERQTEREAWRRLVETAERFPSTEILSATVVFGRLVRTLDEALRLRTSPDWSMNVAALIELLNDEWALTGAGLERVLPPPYSKTVDRLLTDQHLDEAMREKIIFSGGPYPKAVHVARSYFQTRRTRVPPRLGQV
jgi:hypothetical protein